MALGVILGVATWQQAAFATTESSGSTTEKQQLAQLQTRASSEINRRVGDLNALLPLIAKLAAPSAAQQKAYQTAVSQEVASLQQLETAINADATLAAVTADAQKLTPEYDTFMLLAPKMWLIISADWQQTLEANLTTYANKIQDRLNTANNQGEDISAAQVTLNDLQSHISSAQQLSNAVASAAPQSQLGQQSGNHSVLASYYSQLNTAHGSLQTALTDAQTLLADVQRL